MASETDISNLALAHIGESATVASINPPDGSANADHCARFYPMARDALLEMHQWNFCTTRVQLALLAESVNGWQYAYAMPSDAITAILVQDQLEVDALLRETLIDERDAGFHPYWPLAETMKQFQVETDLTGTKILLTNLSGAILRYTRRVTDPTQFSPMFVRVLSWLLAGELAGPIMKGQTGAAAAEQCNGMAQKLLADAKVSDANARRVHLRHEAPWMRARR